MKITAALHGWRALSLTIVFGANFAGAFASAFAAGTVAPTAEVSVRLRPLKGEITVSGMNMSFGGTLPNTQPAVRRLGFDRLSFRRTVTNATDARWTVTDLKTGRELESVQGRKVEIRGETLRVDLRPAPSHLELVAGKSTVNLVGILSVEQYLEGVVASEVPGDWPMEALKAQAVAARSFTLAKVRDRSRHRPDWLLESNVTDQVFDFERTHSRASEAVRETAGEVLTGDLGTVVAANYHSDCGGKTDEPRSVWGGGVKNGTAIDPGCQASSRNSWRFVSSTSELSTTFSRRGLVPGDFKIASLGVVRRSPAGRASELELVAADGRKRRLEGEKVRQALGYGELRSTLFDLRAAPHGAQIEFIGRGFGHGTGLCQWGARQLALDGRGYREILKHYYRRLKLASAALDPISPQVPRAVTAGANVSP